MTQKALKVSPMTQKAFAYVLSALVYTVGCTSPPSEDISIERDAISIEDGLINGVSVGANGMVRAYLGVPYAAPPVGERRWLPPQPVEPWRDTLETTQFSPGCMQDALPVPADADPFFGAGATEFDEDCLYLNVWSAAQPADQLPVLVWIHGGGLVVGDGAEKASNGASLAARGAVVVTINYRLGPFGYLAHPLLREESEHDASGNYGLLDQIAALQWVQRNIAVFGGDPDRVTIFGESAGSWSVNYLMATPLTRGLFAGAIGQSGGVFGPLASVIPRDVAELAGQHLAEATLGPFGEGHRHQVVTLDGLRLAPAEDLLGAAATPRRANSDGWIIPDSENYVFPTRPHIDGWVMPDSVRNIFSAGLQNDVPVIVGANADEGTALRALGQTEGITTVDQYREQARQQYGALADAYLAVYPAATDAEVVPRLIDSLGDGAFVWEMRTWARMMETVSSPTYLYFFTRVPPAIDSDLYGAYHTAEIPYVFNNLVGGSRYWYANRDYDDTDRKLSEVMSSYWINFAASGNPNKDDLPEWPAYTHEADVAMELSDTVQTKQSIRKERLDFFDEYYGAQD